MFVLLHKYHFSVSEHKLCWSNILDALILPQYNAENVLGFCLQLVACVCMYFHVQHGPIVGRAGYFNAGGHSSNPVEIHIFKKTIYI